MLLEIHGAAHANEAIVLEKQHVQTFGASAVARRDGDADVRVPGYRVTSRIAAKDVAEVISP